MLIVAVLPSILVPRKKQPVSRIGGRADSSRVARESIPGPAAMPSPLPAYPPNRLSAAKAETVWVTSPLYRLGFSTQGGELVWAELTGYRSFAPQDSGRPVQLVPQGVPLLASALTAGGDTVRLADWRLTPSASALRVGQDTVTLRFTASRGGADLSLEYRFFPGEYGFQVRGQVARPGGGGGATLLVGLGDGVRSVEADSIDDFRHYAVVTKAAKTQSTAFLKPGERKVLDGPFEWAGVKSKYFFVAALAIAENQPQFGGGIAVGGPSSVTASSLFGKSGVATRTALALTLPVPPAGAFGYDVYVGPLEYRRLPRLGRDLDDANPYGGVPRAPLPPGALLVGDNLILIDDRVSLPYRRGVIHFCGPIRLLLLPLQPKTTGNNLPMPAAA